VAIKEKVRKYITKRNAREGMTESGSGDAGMLLTPIAENPAQDGAGGSSEGAAQFGVEN
jgi:hypothetical protein